MSATGKPLTAEEGPLSPEEEARWRARDAAVYAPWNLPNRIWRTLDAERAKVEALAERVRKLEGTSAEERARWEAKSHYPMPDHGWTCFHCGETFMLPGMAREHFGASPLAEAACRIKTGDERRLVGRLRGVEAERDAAEARATAIIGPRLTPPEGE